MVDISPLVGLFKSFKLTTEFKVCLLLVKFHFQIALCGPFFESSKSGHQVRNFTLFYFTLLYFINQSLALLKLWSLFLIVNIFCRIIIVLKVIVKVWLLLARSFLQISSFPLFSFPFLPFSFLTKLKPSTNHLLYLFLRLKVLWPTFGFAWEI